MKIKGKPVFIRTLMNYYTGRVKRITKNAIELTEAAWIADTGRFSTAMSKGDFSEVEPYPDGITVAVSRCNIIDTSRSR